MTDIEYLQLVSEKFRDVADKSDALIETIKNGLDEEGALKDLLFAIFKAQAMCDSAKNMVSN